MPNVVSFLVTAIAFLAMRNITKGAAFAAADDASIRLFILLHSIVYFLVSSYFYELDILHSGTASVGCSCFCLPWRASPEWCPPSTQTSQTAQRGAA